MSSEDEFLDDLRKAAKDPDKAPNDDTHSIKDPSVSPAGAFVQIGHYKLLREIGEGGMGKVWLAEQLEPVKRRVALKLIKTGGDSKIVTARFEAERQALALMDHPSIAKILDGGTSETGQPYFVMELVHGQPITQYCDQLRLSLPERLDLFAQVCNAVHHAHQKGIIHRDLKPSNILVATYDGKPVPKVIDFGLAKALDHQSKLTDKTLFTEFGVVVGTFQYMSPEQADLDAIDIDTRSDVYALGVLLYELLTGSTPIEKESLRNLAKLRVLQAIRETDPPRPSVRLSSTGNRLSEVCAQRQIDPTRLQHELKGDLDWIVMKALEKNRSRRYESASGFSADIVRYLTGQPVVARPPSNFYKISKFAKKNQRAVLAASAMVFLLVAGMIGTTWGLLEAQRQARDADQANIKSQAAAKEALTARDREKEQRETAERNLTRAKQAEAEIKVRIEELDSERKRLARVTTFQTKQIDSFEANEFASNLRQSLLSEFQSRLAVSDLSEEEVYDSVAELSNNLSNVSFVDVGLAAIEKLFFTRSITLLETEFADDPGIRAELLGSIGNSMRNIGLLRQSSDPLKMSLELTKRAFPPNDPRVGKAYIRLAEQKKLSLALSEARELYLEGIALLSKGENIDERELAKIRSDSLDLQEDLSAAEAAYQTILSQIVAKFGESDETAIYIENAMLLCVMSQFRFDEAEEKYANLLSRARASLGKENRLLYEVIANYGVAKQQSNPSSIHEAEDLYRESLAGFESILGKSNTLTLQNLFLVAGAVKSQKRYEEAEGLFLRGFKIGKEILGGRNELVLTSLTNYGLLLEETGRLDEAEAAHRESFLGLKAVHGASSIQSLSAQSCLSDLLMNREKYAEAIQHFEYQVDIVSSGKREEIKPSLPTIKLKLAICLHRAGKKEDAAEILNFNQLEACAEKTTMVNEIYMVHLGLGHTTTLARAYPTLEPIFRSTYQGDNISLAFGLQLTADMAIEAGEFEKAEQLCTESLGLLPETATKQWGGVRTRVSLARACLKLGQIDRAKTLLEEAEGVLSRIEDKLNQFVRDFVVTQLQEAKETIRVLEAENSKK